MRVPLSWLADELALPTQQPDEVADAFVRVGLEVEEVAGLGPVTGPLVVGRVAEVTELTQFKKPIRFCRVEVGEDEPRGIVCGARNFAVGDLVVVALPGAVLPGDFRIAARTTYDHVSDGMICSARELGLGTDHAGIMVLPPATAEPGADAHAVLGLDDTVIDLAITPDRGYCFSVRGLTRELASAFGVPHTDRGAGPAPDADGPSWDVTVDDDARCTRFTARRVTGLDPAARTPWWLARRLLLAGVRPISPAVDVTNYVMLELGHPLHAFDADRVTGGLHVRVAAAGERLTTLDGAVRTLVDGDVVISDDTGPVSLAGVMGGASTEVHDGTTTVLLEAAVWDTVLIARTARHHKLPSEASRRYERAVDPALSAVALDRAAHLLADIAGGTVEPGRTDVGGVPVPADVVVPVDLPDRVAGTTYPVGAAAARLAEIGATVVPEQAPDGTALLRVTPPTWRPDLTQPADLVEEVLRLEGYDAIPSVLPAAPPGRGLTPVQRRRRAVSRALAAAGCTEVLPSVFLPAGVFDAWGLADDDPLRRTAAVLNPLEADRGRLATTLLPSLLEALTRNVSRGQRDVALFSVAQVVLPDGEPEPVDRLAVDRRPSEDELAALAASLPAQPVHVAAVLAGRWEPAGWWGPGRAAEVHDAIALAQVVASAAGVTLVAEAGERAPFHPGRCARLRVGEQAVGWAGELHPAVVERSGLPARTVAVELDLDALPLAPVLPAPAVSPFPPLLQDVAVVVDDAVPAESVADALRVGGGALLEDLRLFDVYRGAQVGEGRASLAFALRFRAPDRTLTEDEASAARDAAVAEAHRVTGATLRG
ncbi:phenylalanine--tRNA ligase subunit beta [Rhodococcus aerolatus]